MRIAIVGCGNVGATFAYALLLSRLTAEIVLIDLRHDRARGEAMDLNHAMAFVARTHIWAGDFPDCAGAAVTVVAAGGPQHPGETRLDLLQRNFAIFSEIIPQIAKHNPGGILLIATNPVDVLTWASWKLSALPASRVIGSGTVLDTARFRFLLGEHFKVDPRSVHAHIIGEHGDSEVPVWSLASIGGMRLRDFAAANNIPCDAARMEEIFRSTRDAAYQIIACKGATYYAIAEGLVRIVEAILRDQKTVLSVSTLVQDYYGISGLCLSLPSVIGNKGVERVLRLGLDSGEQQALRRSAEVLRQAIQSLPLA